MRCCILSVAAIVAAAALPAQETAHAATPAIQYDSLVAKREPGPHAGGGETTAFSFFDDAGLTFVFRKRALHPGSAIGYHRNDVDEIYYVLSGRGDLSLDGVHHVVSSGTAILTRAGSSHGLQQLGPDDLVIFISYPRPAATPPASRP